MTPERLADIRLLLNGDHWHDKFSFTKAASDLLAEVDSLRARIAEMGKMFQALRDDKNVPPWIQTIALAALDRKGNGT